MGPRARRRLALAALCVAGLAVAIGVTYFVTRPPSNRPATVSIGDESVGISYGFTPAQVARRLGQPSTKHAGCWTYRTDGGKVAGILAATTIDEVRFCFSGGVVQKMADHERLVDSRGEPQWHQPFIFRKAPDHPVTCYSPENCS